MAVRLISLPLFLGALAVPLAAPIAAQAQEAGGPVSRIRVALGPEFTPAYPGADRQSLSPFFYLDRAQDGEEFAYEAPDESFSFTLLSIGNIHIGPALAITDKRTTRDTMEGLRTVGTTIEPGLSITANLSSSFYGFAETHRGLGGHDAWNGRAGLDYIFRQGDAWLLSAGPRLTWGDGKHTRTYFGVSPAESAETGVPFHKPSAGIQSVGTAVGGMYQLNNRWGLAAYGGYARLVGDAARSPIVKQFGSRDQWSAGIALSYSFTRRTDRLW